MNLAYKGANTANPWRKTRLFRKWQGSGEINIKINSKYIKDLNIKYIWIPHSSVVSFPSLLSAMKYGKLICKWRRSSVKWALGCWRRHPDPSFGTDGQHRGSPVRSQTILKAALYISASRLKIFFFFAAPPGMRDLSSLTRDQTRTPCSGSTKS